MLECVYQNRATRIRDNKIWFSRVGQHRDFDITRMDALSSVLVILPHDVRRLAILDERRLLIELKSNEDFIIWGDPVERQILPCPLVDSAG